MATFSVNDFFYKQFLIKLKFKRNTTFHFYHGGKLYGLISRVLNLHPIGKEIVITPCETGRINYGIGDEYNFGIAFLKNDPDLIVKLLSNLYDIPESDYPGDLTNNTIELTSIKEIEIPNYKLKKSSDNIYTFKFTTPLRVLRREDERKVGKRYFDPDYFDPQHFLKLMFQRIDSLYKLNLGSHLLTEIPVIPTVEILDKCFIWVDMPMDNTTLGGIQGTITLKMDLNEQWLKLLSIGQVVHAGKNTSFGFGEFYINEFIDSTHLIKPVKSYLDIILGKENLLNAFNHVKRNSDCAGVDGVTPDDFELNLDENIDSIIQDVKNGNYQSSDLFGMIIPKSDSKIRALAIPTFKDRILQRAVVQILGESIDHLLEENSFAYRKGLSRAGAAQAINEARKIGFNYVLESDVQSFFDNVDWELLFKKIDIVLGTDPICGIIKQWVKANVIYNGNRIKRAAGLPQGAAISPLLANLFLDEFDEALQDDFKLVRYADDFIILCKSKEQAEEALTAAKKALKNLKLEIKPSKTSIISFDDGFQYLGYLFVKSLIIDKPKEKNVKKKKIDLEIIKETLSHGSWLTLIDFEQIKQIKQIPKPEIKPLMQNEVVELILDKYPLYISNNAFVHVDSQNIELTFEENKQQKNLQFPLNSLGSVIIYGAGRITMPTVLLLNEKNIPVYFCRANGELRLSIPVQTKNFDLWLNQLECSKDENFTLSFAKEIVHAKINNHKVIARRTNIIEDSLDEFNRYLNKIPNAESLESLRGLEGSSAALFFKLLNNSLPVEWKFDFRTKRPPEDPVNAMLSFGYTILYHHISTVLQAEGLNPQISFYHQSNNRYFPLASDLQEEFRHIIDVLVLNLIRRNMVSFNDFILDGNSNFPCLMTKTFRKEYIQHVEERLKILFKPFDTSKQITYKQFISYQVKVLKTGLKNNQMCYKALKIR